MYELLKELCGKVGPSGFEQDVQRFIFNAVKDNADEVKVDGLGNVIAKVAATDSKLPSILFAAHSDEIGFVIKKIEPNGTLRFEQLGGFDNRVLLAQPVTVKGSNGYIHGVIGTISAHYAKWDELKKIPSHRDMYIDIGAASSEEVAEMGVKVGQPASYGAELKLAGDGKRNRVVGKGLDDRAGSALLMKVLEGLKAEPDRKHGDVYLAFTVQEEVGLRGASVLADEIRPDFALAVDTTPTSDTYDVLMTGTRSLGLGPCIKVADRSLIASPLVTGLLEQVALEQNIPHQKEIFMGIGTDAGAIHMGASGIPSGVISIPSRYTHSPIEIVDLDDLENSLKLAKEFIYHSATLKGKTFLDT